MRVEGRATSVSWIPSESVQGWLKGGFDLGLSHYDDPPRDEIHGLEDLRALRDDDRFRFANMLSGWAEFGPGGTTGGYAEDSDLVMGSTRVRLVAGTATFLGYSLPVLRADPVVEADRVVLTQTVGGRTGVPLPRPVSRPPFVRYHAPIVWTTLRLTLTRDGERLVELAGASAFPRHWVYDSDGTLVLKSAVTRLQDWLNESFGPRTPWGDSDSPALTVAAESAAERAVSSHIMRSGARSEVQRVAQGTTLVTQGEEGTDVHLVLDGVLDVEVDGCVVAELGPGAVMGERAALEGGRRSATVVARTDARLVRVPVTALEPEALRQVAEAHGAGSADTTP